MNIKNIANLPYNDGADQALSAARLEYLIQFCMECESTSCQFNHNGECRFALVHEREPRINDHNGCVDGCIDFKYHEKETENMEISNMLTLSITHIPESVAKALENEPESNQFGLSVYPFAYGFWICVPHEIPPMIPESVAACLSLAKENDCQWLCFDCDTEPLDTLPVF